MLRSLYRYRWSIEYSGHIFTLTASDESAYPISSSKRLRHYICFLPCLLSCRFLLNIISIVHRRSEPCSNISNRSPIENSMSKSTCFENSYSLTISTKRWQSNFSRIIAYYFFSLMHFLVFWAFNYVRSCDFYLLPITTIQFVIVKWLHQLFHQEDNVPI